MAEHSTFLVDSKTQRQVDVGAYNLNKSCAFANSTGSTGGSQNDTQRVFQVTRAGRIVGGVLNQQATLGASCTLKAQRKRAAAYTDISPATTAGGASIVRITPIDVEAGDEVVLAIGGANVGAAATVDLDILMQH